MNEQVTSFEEKLCMQWKQTELIGGDPFYYLDESHAVSINNYIDHIDIVFFERVKENDKYYCRVTKKHSLDAKKIKEDFESLNEINDPYYDAGYRIGRESFCKELQELAVLVDELTAKQTLKIYRFILDVSKTQFHTLGALLSFVAEPGNITALRKYITELKATQNS